MVNGKLIAHGEVVVIDDKFGLKITEIRQFCGLIDRFDFLFPWRNPFH